MRAGDGSGLALLLVVARPLCPFPCASAAFRYVAYRVTYLFRRVACSRGVNPMLSCCFAFLVGVFGRAQVPYSYCMHFAKFFGARNVQLSRLGGSFVRCFSVCVLLFSASPNSGVKFCGGFLRSENTIFPFIFAGCASFSWFFIFLCCIRARQQRSLGNLHGISTTQRAVQFCD